jgi:hypothetical protein
MTCQTAQELILESLDCQIDEEQKIRLELHIAECDLCRSFGKAQRVLDAALAAHDCGRDGLRSVAASFTRRGLYRRHRIDVCQLCPANDVSVLAGRLGRTVDATRLPPDLPGSSPIFGL